MMTAGPDGDADAVAVARTLADALRTRTMAVLLDVGDRPVRVAVAETTLEAVLTTLVENSAQAGASEVTIAIRAGRHATVTVTDDGGGIPAADRDRVFEPFFTSRRAAGGTGLGLPIARSLLAASGGDLRTIDVAAGAAFELCLPRLAGA